METSIQLSTVSKESFDLENELYQIHREIYEATWMENLEEGWLEYTKGKSLCAETAKKVFVTAAGVFIVCFSSTSILFGVLAYKQGVEDIRNDGRGPIVGHLSEWTMQALFSVSVYGQFLNEMSLLGEQKKAHQIFLRHIMRKDLDAEQRNLIYGEYLEFLRDRPATSWIDLPSLPKVAGFENDPTTLGTDCLLQLTYEALEESMSNISYSSQLKEGWKIIRRDQTACKRAATKTLAVAGGTFLLFHFVNYSMGIYWSGQQAYEDYQNGQNPSIGGHSLEWSVEVLATLNATLYCLGEIGRVGRAKLVADLFFQKITPLRNERDPASQSMTRRLVSEMRKTVGKLQGGLLKIPLWNLFQKA